MDILFEHAAILTRNDQGWQVLPDAWLGIRGDRIAYLDNLPPQDEYAVRKNLVGHAILPGLFNLHSHTPMALLRGLGSNLPLDRWLFEKIQPVEYKMTAADESVGARISMMEMIAGGVVSFSDMYMAPAHYAEEVVQSGMRANIATPTRAVVDGIRVSSVPDALAFFDRYHQAANGRICADFALHAEYTSTIPEVEQITEICLERGAILQLHLSETIKEHTACKQRHGKTPAKFFYDLGTFDNPTIAAHCVVVEPEDIEILFEKRVTAVHNPSSNMKLGSGFMPLAQLRQRGVNLALGTDGSASNNNQNFFEEMHLAALIHCGYRNDPLAVMAEEVLTMATLNGAIAQRRPDCGAIAVGNQADLAIIDLDKPHLMPNHDLISLLVYSAQASDVVMTIVAGELLYDHGEFLTIDRDRVQADLKKSLARLF